MARPVGKPDVEEYITIPILKDWVISSQRSRYVFVEHFLSRVRQLSEEHFGSLSLYHRVTKTLGRKLYNTATIYGLEAIDIDNPHLVVVSAWLKFVVVPTERELAPCTFGVVKKKKI